jgi:hypothetical protein
LTLPIIDFFESPVQLKTDIPINRSIPQVYFRQWHALPLIVAASRELGLHVFVRWVNDGGCQITHASPIARTIEIDHILNVNPIMFRNFNAISSKPARVTPDVNSCETNSFMLKEFLQCQIIRTPAC